jgi:hypothetical protein
MLFSLLNQIPVNVKDYLVTLDKQEGIEDPYGSPDYYH